jgi:Chaperone of endosialidase
MKKRNRIITTMLLGLGFLALSSPAHAVVPSPDGGYPGGNTAEGQSALFSLTSGGYNTAVGFFSLRSNTTASFNTAVGAGTLVVNAADENTATGTGALFSTTLGGGNTGNGAFALFSDTEGSANTASGDRVLFSNTTGAANTASGASALVNNVTGGGNTVTGFVAFESNTTGSFNTALGYRVGSNVTTANNVIVIGANVTGENVSDSCYIGNIWGQSGGSQAVYVNSEGKLGALVSSCRFKDEIKPMEEVSEAIYDLKPVSFRYKSKIEPTRPLCFGLIAEQVEKINGDLVTRDSNGHATSVRYDAVNAMLLNEFLKEHRKNEQQEATINQLKSAVVNQEATIAQQQKDFQSAVAQQQKETETLVARLDEQARLEKHASQIQKARAQPEINTPKTVMVLNNQ